TAIHTDHVSMSSIAAPSSLGSVNASAMLIDDLLRRTRCMSVPVVRPSIGDQATCIIDRARHIEAVATLAIVRDEGHGHGNSPAPPIIHVHEVNEGVDGWRRWDDFRARHNRELGQQSCLGTSINDDLHELTCTWSQTVDIDAVVGIWGFHLLLS